VGSSVPFQVERVVESFSANRAQVSFDVAVTFEVTTQHSLLRKHLVADAAPELVIAGLFTCTLKIQFIVTMVPQHARCGSAHRQHQAVNFAFANTIYDSLFLHEEIIIWSRENDGLNGRTKRLR